MMININFKKTLTAGFVLSLALYPQAWAINQEIDCPSDSPAGSHCWQCGSNCYATLTGTTMNITGSGSLDETYSDNINGKWITRSSWRNYNIETVNIGKNITSIGREALNGLSIQKINFEEGSKIVSIGQGGFGGNSATHVILPSGVGSLGISAFSGSQNIYCTASQMSGVCKDLTNAKQYEKQGDKLIITDDDKTEIYSLDFSKQYDTKGNIIAAYSEYGNLLAQYSYDSGGNIIASYDANGIATYRRTSYTPAEAAKAVKKGNNNKVTFTFK